MGDTSGGKEIYLLESNLADGEKSSFYNFFVSILASQAPAVYIETIPFCLRRTHLVEMKGIAT